MTKEELKLTSKEALGKIKKLIFIIGEILVAESKQDISPEEAIQRIRKTCNKYGINRTGYETIKQDLDQLEKLEKENQELKEKVNYLEKVIEGIKNLPNLDCTHMFDNCKKLTPLPEVKELKKVGQMTYLQKVLIENMNEFCSEKFDLSYERTQEEAEEYINRNIEEYKSLTTHNWY